MIKFVLTFLVMSIFQLSCKPHQPQIDTPIVKNNDNQKAILNLFPYVTQDSMSGSYYWIANQIGGESVFPGFQNFMEDSTRIIVQSIVYFQKTGPTRLIFANMMGGQVGMVLATQQIGNEYKIIYSERFRSIDSIIVHNFAEKNIYEVIHTQYTSGMACIDVQAYSIYADSANVFEKSYDGALLEHHLYFKNSVCQNDSLFYTQTFSLKYNGNKVILEAKKTDGFTKAESSAKYVLCGLQFVEAK